MCVKSVRLTQYVQAYVVNRNTLPDTCLRADRATTQVSNTITHSPVAHRQLQRLAVLSRGRVVGQEGCLPGQPALCWIHSTGWGWVRHAGVFGGCCCQQGGWQAGKRGVQGALLVDEGDWVTLCLFFALVDALSTQEWQFVLIVSGHTHRRDVLEAMMHCYTAGCCLSTHGSRTFLVSDQHKQLTMHA